MMWKSMALALLPAWGLGKEPINQADLQPAGLDDIYRHLYQSYRLNITAPALREQQEFSSETWKYKESASLRDNDRKFLFDMYKSVDSVFEYGLGESTKIGKPILFALALASVFARCLCFCPLTFPFCPFPSPLSLSYALLFAFVHCICLCPSALSLPCLCRLALSYSCLYPLP
jgi:hypothetical protein